MLSAKMQPSYARLNVQFETGYQSKLRKVTWHQLGSVAVNLAGLVPEILPITDGDWLPRLTADWAL